MHLSLPSALMLLGGLGLMVFGLRGLDSLHGTFGGRFAPASSGAGAATTGTATK